MSDLPATYIEGFHNLDAVRRMIYRPLGRTGMTVSKLSFGELFTPAQLQALLVRTDFFRRSFHRNLRAPISFTSVYLSLHDIAGHCCLPRTTKSFGTLKLINHPCHVPLLLNN